MKVFLFALVSMMLSQAMASSPHDRVCLGSVLNQESENVNFILQWRIERTYDHGHSSEDNHKVSIQARTCVDDFSDLCSIVKPKPVILEPNASSLVAIQLIDGGRELFFDGQFDISKEELIRKGKSGNESKIALRCVTQPFLNFTNSNDIE